MPTRLIVQEKAFTPDEIKTLIFTFEDTLSYLNWVKRDDEVALVIARQILAIAALGERDPQKLRTSTLSALRLGPNGMM